MCLVCILSVLPCHLFAHFRFLKFKSRIFLLLQVDDTRVIRFLLSTEIIPTCLPAMEMGSVLSKTVECHLNAIIMFFFVLFFTFFRGNGTLSIEQLGVLGFIMPQVIIVMIHVGNIMYLSLTCIDV